MLPERFWAKVDKNGPEGFHSQTGASLGPCWVWMGCVVRGYGRFRLGKASLAHRLSYEDANGPIPEGLGLDHLCRLRCCSNPTHLEPVTTKVNALRSPIIGRHGNSSQAAKKTCAAGHRFTKKNTKIDLHPDGSFRMRRCRECIRVWSRERRARIKEAA